MANYRHLLVSALHAVDEQTLRAEIRSIISAMDEEAAANQEAAYQAETRSQERAAAIAPSIRWFHVGDSMTGVLIPWDGEKEAYIWAEPGAFGFTCGGLHWRWPKAGTNLKHLREPEERARALARRARRYLRGKSLASPAVAATMRFREAAVRALWEATKWADHGHQSAMSVEVSRGA